MPVHRQKGSPYYYFDFQIDGQRFSGSTKRTERRAAEQVERDERRNAERRLAEQRTTSTSLLINDVADRYWIEVGQYHSGADNTWRDLKRVVGYFGATKLLTEVTDDDVAQLVAWRRQHKILRSKKADPATAPLISSTTVNRSTTEVLKKLFTRAKAWGVQFRQEPNWSLHFLEEPQERVRELVGKEGDKLDDAAREDYGPFLAFAKATGLRLRECLLRWPEVDWDARQIRKKGKGKRLVTAPITSEVRAILRPLMKHHDEFVFTYVAKRTRKGKIKGVRYPITYSGAKTEWRRQRARSGVSDFRFHDFRHDLATKVLRKTGNLKLVQRVLNHADLKTTARYAHVLDSEVAEALEDVAKTRKKSGARRKKAG